MGNGMVGMEEAAEHIVQRTIPRRVYESCSIVVQCVQTVHTHNLAQLRGEDSPVS